MTLSRRHLIAGLGALALSGCASPGPGPMVRQRVKATAMPVMNPADIGLNAVVDLHHRTPVQDFAMARLYGGLRGVFHKASEGNDWADPLYAQRREMAMEAGLLWGAYHFGTRMHSGAEQANFFLTVARPGPDTLLVLDLELNERAPGNSMTLGQAEEFVAVIRDATGRLPLIYVQPAWADGEVIARYGQSLGGMVRPDSLLGLCDLWLADYRMEPELPAAWERKGWRFWQYVGDSTAGGSGPFGPLSRSLPGIDHCDRNLFAGDEASLLRYWTGLPTATSA